MDTAELLRALCGQVDEVSAERLRDIADLIVAWDEQDRQRDAREADA